MPLHDWTDSSGWEGQHQYWITAIGRHLRETLPSGYRAVLGTAPTMGVGGPALKPDVSVRRHADQPAPSAAPAVPAGSWEPDGESVAVTAPEAPPAVLVERERRLVAIVEIVSPRNKDRPSSRSTTVARFAGYLLDGIHLLAIDLLPHPYGFSVASEIEADVGLPTQPALTPPFVASYRMGEPVPPAGRFIAYWRRSLHVGQPLPTIPLALSVHQSVLVDLEATYLSASRDNYMDQ